MSHGVRSKLGKWKRSSEALIEKFHECMEYFEDIDTKKMFGYPCYFKNGNMFTGLHEENWVLRLPESDREAILTLGAKPFEPMGRKMREYILLPQDVLLDANELKGWVQRSLNFVSTLPHK